MFNRWKPYPMNKPAKRGWYICSIRYGEDPDQAYVMELFWDEIREVWRDNRRINVFQEYEVYGYGENIINQTVKKRLYTDNLCERNDVVAFKRMPKIYRWRRYDN